MIDNISILNRLGYHPNKLTSEQYADPVVLRLVCNLTKKPLLDRYRVFDSLTFDLTSKYYTNKVLMAFAINGSI